MAWRYLAQQALTGELLDLDLPLTREELRWDRPGLARSAAPSHPSMRSSTTATACQCSGRPARVNGPRTCMRKSLAVSGGAASCNGHGTPAPYGSLRPQDSQAYPQGMSYKAPTTNGPQRTLQAYSPLSGRTCRRSRTATWGLRVVLPGNCPVRIGTAAEPYELAWWENTDCGAELGQLAQETPFDFTESHDWAGTSTIAHKVTVAYPRVGRRREDLVFNQDNLREVVELERDGSPGAFANVSYVVGKGEGATTVHGYDGVRDGRLRRMTVYTDKLASTKARAKAGQASAFGAVAGAGPIGHHSERPR